MKDLLERTLFIEKTYSDEKINIRFKSDYGDSGISVGLYDKNKDLHNIYVAYIHKKDFWEDGEINSKIEALVRGKVEEWMREKEDELKAIEERLRVDKEKRQAIMKELMDKF